MSCVSHCRAAPVAKKKEVASIFSSKSAFSEKSNDSGENKQHSQYHSHLSESQQQLNTALCLFCRRLQV